ncbi:hypothetical protein [Treponema phagedenis]|nr:hypothetical protein [Treponema phagedenis]
MKTPLREYLLFFNYAMTCEKIIDTYLKLDKYERVPIGITLHLLRCRSCRETVKKLSKVYTQHRKKEKNPSPELVEDIMQNIYQLSEKPVQTETLSDAKILLWMLTGLLIVIGFIILPFTEIGQWGINHLGIAFIIPFALICAISVSAFYAVFVGKNIDFFVKQFDLPTSLQ